MTEQEWLISRYPDPMLLQMRRKASNRKFRLAACACCRRLWHSLGDESRNLIETLEQRADGSVDEPRLTLAIRRYHAAHPRGVRAIAGAMGPGAWAAAWQVTSEVCRAVEEVRQSIRSEEMREQAAILRDIFGNPFRQMSKRPQVIAPLAAEIYASHWDLMPLLGEWLQEHGHWQEGEHCLDPNIRHVKGCHVVDWVTGRE
jgi:hypothetical protein